MIKRRNFLKGLASLIVAPAIVKPFNIMPVKIIDPYNTRFLWAYNIHTDSMFLRVDRALHTLPIPYRGAEQIPAYIAYKFIPKNIIEAIKPAEFEQKNLTVALTGRQLLEAGYRPNDMVIAEN